MARDAQGRFVKGSDPTRAKFDTEQAKKASAAVKNRYRPTYNQCKEGGLKGYEAVKIKYFCSYGAIAQKQEMYRFLCRRDAIRYNNPMLLPPRREIERRTCIVCRRSFTFSEGRNKAHWKAYNCGCSKQSVPATRENVEIDPFAGEDPREYERFLHSQEVTL